VTELSFRREEFQAGGLNALTHGEGPEAIKVWLTEPKVLTAGSTAVLRYNTKAGPLHWVEWDAGEAPILKVAPLPDMNARTGNLTPYTTPQPSEYTLTRA
jgi:hypothetical protein